MHANYRAKEIRSSIDQDGKGWLLNEGHDLANPARVEAKTLQGPLKKAPVHLIIRLLHIQFNRQQTTVNRSMVQVIYDFLSNKNLSEILWPPTKALYSGHIR